MVSNFSNWGDSEQWDHLCKARSTSSRMNAMERPPGQIQRSPSQATTNKSHSPRPKFATSLPPLLYQRCVPSLDCFCVREERKQPRTKKHTPVSSSQTRFCWVAGLEGIPVFSRGGYISSASCSRVAPFVECMAGMERLRKALGEQVEQIPESLLLGAARSAR